MHLKLVEKVQKMVKKTGKKSKSGQTYLGFLGKICNYELGSFY